MKIAKETQEFIKGETNLKTINADMDSDVENKYNMDCPNLDIPFGGGYPSGKIMELFGPPSAGKSSLAQKMVISFSNFFEKKNDSKYVILWQEVERAFDKTRAHWMGVPVHKMAFDEKSSTIEDIFETQVHQMKKALKLGYKLLIVTDTIDAVPTRNEKDFSEGIKKEYSGGRQEKPRVIKKFLKDIAPLAAASGTTIIFLNQVYTQQGQFTIKLVSGGGLSLKHYNSILMLVTRDADIMKTLPNGKEEFAGFMMKCKFIKNKITGMEIETLVTLYFETGINSLDSCIKFLKMNKVCTISGSWAVLQIPEKLFDNKEKKIKMVEAKFQNTRQCQELIDVQYPHLKDWIHYLIYQNYTTHGSLIKIKIIKKVWEYEKMFFGKQMTVLNEREIETAKILYKKLQNDEVLEIKKEEKIKGKKK